MLDAIAFHISSRACNLTLERISGKNIENLEHPMCWKRRQKT